MHHLTFWNVSFVLFRTLGLIKPDAMQRVGDILAEVQRNGFLITNLCMTQLSRNEAFDLYKDHQSKPNFKWVAPFYLFGFSMFLIMKIILDQGVKFLKVLSISDEIPNKFPPLLQRKTVQF